MNIRLMRGSALSTAIFFTCVTLWYGLHENKIGTAALFAIAAGTWHCCALLIHDRMT